MSPRKRKGSRIYWREQGENRRAYADFRDFADVGGGKEALIAQGEKLATTDEAIASQLVADRLRELQEMRRNKTILGIEKTTTLGEYIAYHLIEKKKSRKVTDRWIAASEARLKRAIEFFEEDGPREIHTIKVADVQQWLNHLRTLETRRKAPFESGTLRKHLYALSNVFRRASAEEYVPAGYNPPRAIMDKPEEGDTDAEWLEVYEAALFLEAARHYRPHKSAAWSMPATKVHALIATFLLTGARETEVYGLSLADDVSFDRRTIRIRKNETRRIKNRGSKRVLTMWPQLEEILREYVFGSDGPPGELLYPRAIAKKKVGSTRGDGRITDSRKTLDAIATSCGWKEGEIRTKMFRHTYCAARLQTLDNGAPVSLYTVAGEMGHGGLDLVKRVYGHLGEIRHRSSVVEYRIDHHREQLQDRLNLINAGH